MKAKKVTYSRLISLGNYENAKIEIELEVENGETANVVFENAKKWVDSKIALINIPHDVNWAERVLREREEYKIKDIERAQAILDDYQQMINTEDSPF